MMARASRVNKQERAYQLIRRRIVSGVYAPAQRLVIDSLARDLEMSQVPIREAIRQLEAEGWVVYRTNAGPMVAFVSREEWVRSMQVLAVLEGYATAEAAAVMRDEHVDELRQINDAMRTALLEFDLITFSTSNRAFHTAIYAHCPNTSLVDQATATRTKLDAIRGTPFAPVPQRGAASIAEHDGIVDAIAAHADFERIERLARQHKFNFITAASQAMGALDSDLGQRGPIVGGGDRR
jgi:DNA-binding GntR family transcriptional regulator